MYESKLLRDADPNLKCIVNGRPIYLTIDTGAKVTLLSKAFVDALGKSLPRYRDQNFPLQSVTGHLIRTYRKYEFSFQIGTLRFKHSCYVVDPKISAPTDGILGRDIIMLHRLMISLHDSKVILPNGTKVNFEGEICETAKVKSTSSQKTGVSSENEPGRKRLALPGKLPTSNRQIGAKTVYLLEDQTYLPGLKL